MAATTLTLAGLGRTYANGHVAVHDLDLAVHAGEYLVVVGPSGCGKSTVLRLIAGLDQPTSGRVLLGEDDVTDWTPQARDLAMVFQSYALYPHMLVRDNLAYGLRVRGTAPDVAAERVAAVAAALGLEPLLDRRPAQLSGGERQRVALGRAIVREPRAFLFDEPLSNLDPALRAEARAELRRLHGRLGATVVHVTHDQEEALTLGGRVAVLRRGRLEQVAPPLELYTRPVNTFVARFIGAPAMNLVPAARLGVAAAPDALAGLRPQDVRLGAGGSVTAHVELVEPRGADAIVHLRLDRSDGPAMLAVVQGAVPAPGAATDVSWDPRRLHLFDGQTHERHVP
ncbi:MAG: ABC transporter ATP-binding protein [Vicinamibacterales bacterium]